MKKLATLFLGIAIAVSTVGCGSGDKESAAESAKYTSAVEVLQKVADSYSEDQKFPIGGGDSANMTMDAPGKFDLAAKEELISMLSLPEAEVEHIDDAASMLHMMNANLFTGAAYHLKDDVKMEDFAKAAEEAVLNKQWICGMPDTFMVLNAGGQYVVTAYGEASIMDTFEENALSALEGAEVILDTAVVE